jgi:hypothetical protein
VAYSGYIVGTVPLVASSIDWHGAQRFPLSMLGDQVFTTLSFRIAVFI